MGAVESIGGLSDLLNDKTLLKHSALIGGQWVKAKSGAEFSVINPATGKERLQKFLIFLRMMLKKQFTLPINHF